VKTALRAQEHATRAHSRSLRSPNSRQIPPKRACRCLQNTTSLKCFESADGVDLAERPVFQTPGDDMFDRVENLVPGCAKGLRRLFP